MTLIAFSTTRYAAEVLTDSLTYTPTGRTMGAASAKGDVVPALDTMVIARGSVDFHRAWVRRINVLSTDGLADFDALHAATPGELRTGWADYAAFTDRKNTATGAHGTPPSTAVFQVGYSAARDRFAAYGYDSETDFEPVDLTAGHVMPAPHGTRPSDNEMRRLRATLTEYTADDDESRQAAHDMLNRLAAAPAFVPPTTRTGWAKLARRIRTDRALAHIASGMKTPVGGDVTMTRLRRGTFEQRNLLTFNDEGDELVALVSGSLHPLAQHAACPWCDSGTPYVDCCLAERNGHPCPCRSGRTFDTCCSIRAEQASTTLTAAA